MVLTKARTLCGPFFYAQSCLQGVAFYMRGLGRAMPGAACRV